MSRRITWVILAGIAVLALALAAMVVVRAYASEIVYPEGDARLYDAMIEEAAARHGVCPHLVRGVIRQESNFQPRRVGAAGEIGLMQIMPAAAQDWARAHGVEYRFRGRLSDPRFNIEVGTWYLARGLKYWQGYTDADVLALAEYNAGRSRARRWAPENPAENALDRIGFSSTKAYIKNVLKYRDMYAQKGASKP